MHVDPYYLNSPLPCPLLLSFSPFLPYPFLLVFLIPTPYISISVFSLPLSCFKPFLLPCITLLFYITFPVFLFIYLISFYLVRRSSPFLLFSPFLSITLSPPLLFTSLQVFSILRSIHFFHLSSLSLSYSPLPLFIYFRPYFLPLCSPFP